MRASYSRSVLLAIFLAGSSGASAQHPAANRMYGGERPFVLEDLPRGALRDRLTALPAPARAKALAWLNRVGFPPEDVASLKVADDGSVFYSCEFPGLPAASSPQASGSPQPAPVPVSPFPTSLVFQSRPAATNIIFLDFDGGVVTNTAWNSGTNVIYTPLAFSTDGDFGSYSDSEQAAIKRIWQRVSEDFAPFDINVTTVPQTGGLTRYTAHVMITRNTDSAGRAHPSSTAGGVAYVGVFGNTDFAFYRPAWAYVNNLSLSEANIGEVCSHEVGHNLNLNHDGQTDGTEYYGGHGSGDTSWGPIMGVSYGRNVSQWSRGEYYLANNAQNDLQIIAGRSGYRVDDAGDTIGTASALIVSNSTFVTSTTPETDPANLNTANKGVIGRTNDVDVFAFSAGAGHVNLTVNPWIQPAGTLGGNLDAHVTLLNGGGGVVTSANPTATIFAAISATVTAGTYYLVISNSAFGTPTNNPPTGYTPYGSRGQYFISGTLPGAFTNPLNVSSLADGPELVRLSWLSLGFDTLVAHNTGSPPSKPVNGTAYSSGSALATGRVVFKGSAVAADHETGRLTTNYYVYYAVNAATQYSAGVTATVVMADYPNGILDAFCYTNGRALSGPSRGAGFTNDWLATGVVYAVTNGPAGNFTFVEPFSPVSSRRLAMDNYVNDTEMRARRLFAPFTSGVLYVAYRVAIEYGFGGKYTGVRLLMTNGAEAAFFGETGADNILGIDGLGVAGTNSAYGINDYQSFSDNAYIVAARFNLDTRRADVTAYYRTQEVPPDEPTSWQASATAAVDRTSVRGLELVTGGFGGAQPGRVFFDEIRVATSWRGLFIDTPTDDTDGDGMSDSFEMAHFGSTTAGDPAGDADGDGFSNYDEFTANSIPTNTLSFPTGGWPRVRGTNGAVIASGDGSPSAADGTDYGSLSPCGGFADHAFSVTNVGTGTLAISSVAVRGASNEFLVVTSPTQLVAGASTSLVIRFDPAVFGARTGSVEITHGGTTNGPYRFAVRGTGSLIAPPATLAFAPGSPFISPDPGGADQNQIGDRFDLATNGTPLQATDACGFGSFGRIYVNYDATNLYIGGEGMDLTADENGAILFIGLDTLSDDKLNAALGTTFSNPPFALNLANNLNFSSPMDIAILLGDEYGDVHDRSFLLGNGTDFGQGVFYLSIDYFGLTNASISQFDGAGTNATLSADDDFNRRTERWEVAIPWGSLNAPAGAASVSNLTLCGVLAGGTLFNTRYLSGNYLAAASSRAPEQYDEFGNIGFQSVTLTPYSVALPAGDFDGDGLPDLWELEKGLSGVASNAPGADADGDGQTDRQEYLADTHPTNGASFFPPVTNFTGAGVNSFNVAPTSTGRVYDVFWRTNLLPETAPWNAFGLNTPGSGSNIVLTVTNTAADTFLRTGVKLP